MTSTVRKIEGHFYSLHQALKQHILLVPKQHIAVVTLDNHVAKLQVAGRREI